MRGYLNSGETVDLRCVMCGDGATLRHGRFDEPYCDGCAPRTMPSRDFLVQQAVLNAAAALWPHMARGLTGTLGFVTLGGNCLSRDGELFPAVCDEFSDLVRQYE